MSEIPEGVSGKVLVSRLALPQERWRTEAEDALVALGESAVDVLLGALHHAEAQVRFHAARALGRIRASRAIGPLAHCLGDAENRSAVAIQAEKALVELGVAAVPALLDLARGGAQGVRPRAVRALGKIPGAPVDALRELLRSPDWTVRAQAVEALARRDPEESIADVLSALSDAEEWVRRAAAEALVNLRRAEGRGILSKVLADPDEELSQKVWAEDLLERLEEYERLGELKRG